MQNVTNPRNLLERKKMSCDKIKKGSHAYEQRICINIPKHPQLKLRLQKMQVLTTTKIEP